MSQQYPYYYGQPPQQPQYNTSTPPDWQSAQHPVRSSWHDPRLAGPPAPGAYVQQATYASHPGSNYQPSYYGPMPGTLGSPVSPIQQPPPIPHYVQDTTAWGVRYNHGAPIHSQTDEVPPALPPRPGSTNSPPQQSHIETQTPSWQPAPPEYERVAGTNAVSDPPPPPPPPPPHPPTSIDDHSARHGQRTQVVGRPELGLQNYSAEETRPPPISAAAQTAKPPTPPPRPIQYQHVPARTEYNHGGADVHNQSAYGWMGGPGAYQSQSPPPILDYNLNAPWSDPILPVSPVLSPQAHQPISSPLRGHYELDVPSPQEPEHRVDEEIPKVSESKEDDHLDEENRVSESGSEWWSRSETVSPDPEFAPIDRTGTIDSVIQAWTKPVQPGHPVTQSTPWHDPGFAPALQQLSLLARPSDPFQDLSPEARASLERFATMLRREATAESDDEKFQIYSTFVQKESRLRAVLYGKDSAEIGNRTSQSLEEKRPSSRNATVKLRESSAQPDNFPEPQADGIVPESVMARAAEQKSDPKSAIGDMVHEVSEIVVKPESKPRDNQDQAPSLLEEPSRAFAAERNHEPLQKGASATTQVAKRHDESAPMRLSSPGADAPIVVETPLPVDTWTNRQQITVVPVSSTPPITNPDRPYTPFTYQAVAKPKTKPTSTEAASEAASAQAYSALRKANSESGRVMAPTIVPPAFSMNQSYPRITPRDEQAEAFLGLLRRQSRNMPQGDFSPIGSDAPPHQPDGSDGILVLKYLVPSTLPQYSESSALSKIKRSLQGIPDDFSFIKGRVLDWSRQNLENKKKLDANRRQRNEESEKNIDSLFNDNEIGYADIASLEAEHRKEEAKMVAEEEVNEANGFSAEVFTFVTERLQSQLNKLAQVYADAMTLVESQSASGSQFIKDASTKTALPQAMDTLLVIFSKMQIRHQKLLEASLERSRRLRKAKVNSLRAAENVAATQEYEIASLKAEQGMIIDTKEKDDDRANFLMDTFDKVSIRGLAENQAYVDELLQPLWAVAELVDTDGSVYDSASLRDVLLSAQAVLEFVAADSISILKFSSTADLILNNADYDVSVAKAYRSDAPPAEFKQLETEKQKEDAKIKEETAAKTHSMIRGSHDVQAVVADLLRKTEQSPQHKQRIEKALERAKLRNASNVSLALARPP